MKLIQLKWLFAILLISTGLFALSAFDIYYHNEYEPILMSRAEMEEAVQIREPREIESPGKIWVYNDFIFIIEKYRGIHVLNNINPENPINLSFIQIDGCTEVAVKSGIIYANNAVDLIGIKPQSDYKSISVVSRNRNILPKLHAPAGVYITGFDKNRPDNTIIVRWEAYKPE